MLVITILVCGFLFWLVFKPKPLSRVFYECGCVVDVDEAREMVPARCEKHGKEFYAIV